ncbi:MAG: PH domain-containing protein [Caldilineaceae bacterium]
MIFKPPPCRTRWEGLVVSFWILLVDSLLFTWVLQRSTDWLRFFMVILIVVSVPILFHLLYRTWGIFTLEYWIDRNAVTIRWANVRQIIPLATIQQIVQGGIQDSDKLRWVHWPAPYVRAAYSPDLNEVTLYATQPLSQCLLLDTGEAVFAISPTPQAEFLEILQERFRMGAVQALQPSRTRTSTLARLFGSTQVGPLLLGLGLLGVLTLFGVLMVQFPDLPNPLPTRYSPDGLPEIVRDKQVLFRLPVIGLFAWLVNGVWGMWMNVRRQPVGAYLLWGSTVVVHLFLLFALRSILP